jgi:hypothetical protein
MKYALNIAEDKRILSAWKVLPNGNYDDMSLVDVLPDGDISDYLYVGGQYIHDPLPEPVQPEPEATTDDVLNALLGVTE